MKYITSIIKKLLQKEIPKPLGRWRLENCNDMLNHKIDLSNEDHCGPCGEYTLEKLEQIKLTNIEKNKNTDVNFKK
jgi:hypothetical protein